MSLSVTQLAPIAHLRLDMFLLGYIAAASAVVALFFLRFWKETRDSLFLAFAVFFFVQGIAPVSVLYTQHPNLVNNWVYGIEMLAVMLVVGAILSKNSGSA